MPTQKTLKELLAFLNLKYHAKSPFIPQVQPSDTVNVRAWWPDWENNHPKNFLSNFFEFVSTCKKSGYFIVHLKTVESNLQREFWSISQEQDFWLYSGWTFWGLFHGKSPPSPKNCHTYPAMIEFGTIIPYQKKIQKIYESHATPLEFCWSQHFFTGNQ